MLVATPVLVVLSFVFVPAGEVWSHLSTTVLPRYVTNTLWLMLGVGSGTLIIGVTTAWLVTMTNFPGRRIFEWALLIPLAIPAYVIAFTYTGLLEYAGPVQSILRDIFGWSSASDYWFPEIRSLPGAIVMMTLVFYPYVYMLARASFLEQSVCVLEASRTLGQGPWATFFRIALPLARPGIAGGLALALMETLNDFGTVDFFSVDTFTTGIYRTWLGMWEVAAAAQLGAMLMLFIFVLILLERWSRSSGTTHHSARSYRNISRYDLKGSRALLANVVCGIPVFIGFILPVGAMIVWTIASWHVVDSRYLSMAASSFALAGIAAVVAVVVAVLLAYGQRLNPTRAMGFAVRLAGMGYAVPGAVIALGIMIPFAWLDNSIDGLARQWLGISTGLLLTGTWVALIFAYVVRFLAVSLNTVEASLGKITPNMDGAARTLGYGATRTLRKVHTPLMWGSLLTAGILVFVDVMKELPATFMMRPFGLETLAIRSYEMANDGFLVESSTSSLAIVAVGIIPVILISVAIARSRPGGSS
nr:iron ABC transporter permease [Desulfurispira natronophila]